ncbi:MAG: hypothetical protein WC685_07545 [Methylobacter sp.]|jgi:glutamate dehydrogenase (NAD(P)+)
MAPFIGRVSIALDVSVDEHFRLANEETYIFGPDMGTNEECMAWVRDENDRSVGLLRELCGIPLDEISPTGGKYAMQQKLRCVIRILI